MCLYGCSVCASDGHVFELLDGYRTLPLLLAPHRGPHLLRRTSSTPSSVHWFLAFSDLDALDVELPRGFGRD